MLAIWTELSLGGSSAGSLLQLQSTGYWLGLDGPGWPHWCLAGGRLLSGEPGFFSTWPLQLTSWGSFISWSQNSTYSKKKAGPNVHFSRLCLHHVCKSHGQLRFQEWVKWANGLYFLMEGAKWHSKRNERHHCGHFVSLFFLYSNMPLLTWNSIAIFANNTTGNNEQPGEQSNGLKKTQWNIWLISMLAVTTDTISPVLILH